MTTTSCDVSASSLEVGEAMIVLHERLMDACPLVEAGSKENWGGLRCLTLYYLGPCLTCMVKGNAIFIATHPERDCCFRGLMLK